LTQFLSAGGARITDEDEDEDEEFLVPFLIAATRLAHASDAKLSPDPRKAIRALGHSSNHPPSLPDLQRITHLAGSILGSLPRVNGPVAKLPREVGQCALVLRYFGSVGSSATWGSSAMWEPGSRAMWGSNASAGEP